MDQCYLSRTRKIYLILLFEKHKEVPRQDDNIGIISFSLVSIFCNGPCPRSILHELQTKNDTMVLVQEGPLT